MITFIAVLWIAAAPFPEKGIAAQYAGDRGLEKDPRVVFVENFEEQSLNEIWQRWETVTDKPGQSLTNDVPPGSSGMKALVMERVQGSGSHLYRRLKNKEGG